MAAAQNLDHAVQFFFAAKQRIQLVVAGLAGQIAAVAVAGPVAAAGRGSALADLLAVLLEQAVCRVPGLMRPSGKNCT